MNTGRWKVYPCLLFLIFTMLQPAAFAQENNSNEITNKILETKSTDELYGLFEQLTDKYFKENKYNEYVGFLKSLSARKKELEPAVNYYIALTRYYQLKHLEEAQDWNEYFKNNNTYREETLEYARQTIDKTDTKEPVNIYAKLILWRLHKDQDDSAAEQALADLMKGVLEYAKAPSNIILIKDVADQLLAYGEKYKSMDLYKIYVEKITTLNTNPLELESAASGFYKEGNLELSELIYDAYINKGVKSLPKQEAVAALIKVAGQFSVKGAGVKDLSYADKVFKEIEDIGGKDAFTEDLLYLRALNLEKSREYSRAKDIYMDLCAGFPGSAHFKEAMYKTGIINTYALRDIKKGKESFVKLTDKFLQTANHSESQEVSALPGSYEIASLYQLGLLNQWAEDAAAAKQYYNKLVELAGNNFAEKTALTKERLKELETAKPIEYNLKMFLDLSLKEENASFNMSKLDLKATPYDAKSGEKVNVLSTAVLPESGCMQIKLEHLWSGDLGSVKPASSDVSFDTFYKEPGTKEINLVVVSSGGVLDRSFDLVDIY